MEMDSTASPSTPKSHAFHLGLPPHHMDDDGVPFISKFAEHKSQKLVQLAHSIQLQESLFVVNDAEVDMMEDLDLDEDDEDDDHALPTEYTMETVMKKCIRLQSQYTTLEGLKHDGIPLIEKCRIVLHLLRLLMATVSVQYEHSDDDQPPSRKVSLLFDNAGYVFNEDGKGTEHPYEIVDTAEQLDEDLSQNFALPAPAREALLSVLANMMSKKDTFRAVSSGALFPEGVDHKHRVMLILHWQAFLRMLLRTAPYLDEHKVGSQPTCSSSRQNTIIRRTVHLIRDSRQFFDQGVRPPNTSLLEPSLDATAKDLWNMVKADLLYHTHTHACYRGAILLYLFHPTRCTSRFYSDVLPQWFESWSSIDRCLEFDFVWLVMFCRARKHVSPEGYDWGPLRRRLLTNSQIWLHLPLGGSSMDKSFPRPSNPKSRSCPARLTALVGVGSSYEGGIDFVAKVAKLLIGGIGCNDLKTTASTGSVSDGTADVLRFFSFVSPYFNPSNTGTWTFTLGVFLHYFCYELCHRIGVESSVVAMKSNDPHLVKALFESEPHLADGGTPPHEMVQLMHALLPLCQQAIYSKNGHVGRAGEAALLFLAQIDPLHVTPPFLDFAMNALDVSAVNLSHQAPAALGVLTRLVQPALRKHPEIFLRRLPSILQLTLAGIDSNDQNKSIRTLIFYRNLTSWVPVISNRNNWRVRTPSPSNGHNGSIRVVVNASEFAASFTTSEAYVQSLDRLPKKSLFRQSESFGDEVSGISDMLIDETAAAMGDWVLEFLDKVYDLLRASGAREKAGKNGSQVASRHSSSDVAQARNFSRVLKECVFQVFAAMDDTAHQTAVRSVVQFLANESLPSAAKDVSALCQAAAAARTVAEGASETSNPGLDALVPILLSDLVHSSAKTVIYRLRCLAGAVRYAGRHVLFHQKEISRGVAFALASDEKGIYKTGCKLLRQTLASQSEAYPLLSSYMPRLECTGERDGLPTMGRSAELADDMVRWHVPREEQLGYVSELLSKHVVTQITHIFTSCESAAAVRDDSVSERHASFDVVGLRRCLRMIRYSLRGSSAVLLDHFREQSSEHSLSDIPHEQAIVHLLSKMKSPCASSLSAIRGQICAFAVRLMSVIASETMDGEPYRDNLDDCLGQRHDSHTYRLCSDTKVCKELSEVALLLLTRRGASFRCQEGKTIWRAQKQLVTDFLIGALVEHTNSTYSRASHYDDATTGLYKDGEDAGKSLTRRLLVVRLRLFYEQVQRNASFEIPRRLRRGECTSATSGRMFSSSVTLDRLSDAFAAQDMSALAGYEGLIDGLFALSCHPSPQVRAASIGVVDYAFTRFGWLAGSRVGRLLPAIRLQDADMRGKYGIPSCAQLQTEKDSQGKRTRLAEAMKGVCSILALPRMIRQAMSNEEIRSIFVRTLCETDDVVSVLPLEEMQKMVQYFQNLFGPFRSKIYFLPRGGKNLKRIHAECLRYLLGTLNADTPEEGKGTTSSSKELVATHWRKRLLVGWFLMNLVDEEDIVTEGSRFTDRLWSTCFDLLETEMGQPLQRVAVGLLGRLLSFSTPGSVDSRAGYRTALETKLSEDGFCKVLGRALVYDHREDTTIGGGHDAQWSAGVEDIIRDASRFVALRSLFPFQRTGQSSGTFKIAHAQMIESILLLVDIVTASKVSKELFDFAKDLAVAMPSEDQRNQQVTSAEIFAGVTRASVMRATEDSMTASIDFLKEVVPKVPISLIGAYFDALRYSVQSCSKKQMHPLLVWLISRVRGCLWKPDEIIQLEAAGAAVTFADAASVGADGFTAQSKWLYLTTAVIVEMDEERELQLTPAWYRGQLQRSTGGARDVKGVSEESWQLIREALLPSLVDSVGHPYDSCRDHIAGCLFRIWCCENNIACRNTEHLSNVGSPSQESAAAESVSTVILEKFASLHDADSLSFNERYNALITARKFMAYCNHIGDAKREFSSLVVPLLPMAFEAVKASVDQDKDSTAENTAKRTLEADVAKGFRYMIVEVGSSSIASYLGSADDISLVLEHTTRASKHEYWQVRQAAAHFLRCFQGSHKYLFRVEHARKTTSIVAFLLSDERREVSSAAMEALIGILAATPLDEVTPLIEKYVGIAHRSKMKKKKKNGPSGSSETQQAVAEEKEKKRARNQQTSVFFLCASVLAQPYDTPPYVPVALAAVSKHSFERSAPLGVRDTVKKCCGEYKRTHMSDNWEEHRRAFSQDQLEALEDVVSSPHYYA